MKILGIAPGKNGGLALLDTDDHAIPAQVWKMPETEMDIWDALHHGGLRWQAYNLQHSYRELALSHAFIEKVHAMPGQGVSSTFNFGRNYGMLLMALTAASIPFTEVTPQKWQGVMDCRTGGDKNISKRRAQQLFPNINVHHWSADALLIALYGLKELGL